MDTNVRIAKELVKLAKYLAGASKKIEYSHVFKNSGVLVYHCDVYKSDFPMGYGPNRRYRWSTNKQNEDYYTPEECIIVNIKNNHQEERRTLIDNRERFREIGMMDVLPLNNRGIDVVFSALFVGDYTEKRLNDTVALISEIFNEEPN